MRPGTGLMALVVVGLACVGVTFNGPAESQPSARQSWSYSNRVAEMHVVGEGTVITPDDSTINILLRVDRLLAGTILSRTLRLTVPSEPSTAVPGAKVLFWANRLHEMNWTLYGRYIVAPDSGEISGTVARRFLQLPADSRVLSSVELRSKLEESVRHGAMSHFARIAALVPARVTSVTLGTPYRGVTCLASRIDASNDPRPDTLTVVFKPKQGANWDAPAIGDTLVLPVPGDLLSRRVTLPIAPDLCVVRAGYVRALGLPYALRMDAYRVVDGRLHLRPIQQRDAPNGEADE